MFLLGRVCQSKKVVFHQPEQLFIKGSSQISLFLGTDFAQKGCNQNASLSHMALLILSSLVVTLMWMSNTLFFLFWHLFLSFHYVTMFYHVWKMFCQSISEGKSSDAWTGSAMMYCCFILSSFFVSPRQVTSFLPWFCIEDLCYWSPRQWLYEYSMSGVEWWGGGRLSNLCVVLPDS